MAELESSSVRKSKKRSLSKPSKETVKKKKTKRKDNQEADDKPQENLLALDQSKQKEFEEAVKNLPQGENFIPGVLYVKHLPHGFFEDELRGFFSQFGTVTRVKVPRSRKTARPHGYAFIEFACDEVAKIAASAMDNYLMYDKLVKCTFIPPDKVGKNTFKHAERKFKKIDWNARERKKQNKVRTKEQHAKQVKALRCRDRKRRQKLKELGIDYTFPGYGEASTDKK